MKLVLDLSAVFSGGGLEQSLATLRAIIPLLQERGDQMLLIASKGSKIQEFAFSKGISHVRVSRNLIFRFIFDAFRCKTMLKKFRADYAYTFFGIGLPDGVAKRRVINVAYPIICYPDSPYWEYLPRLKKIITKLKVSLRSKLIDRRSDVIIAESAIMKERLIKYCKYRKTKIVIMPPVLGRVSEMLSEGFSERNHIQGRHENKYKILFVSGVDHHKNLWRLMEAVAWLKKEKSGRNNFVFQITTTKAVYIDHCNKAGIECDSDLLDQYYEFLGPLFGTQLARYIVGTDLYGNISDLESISNNFIEAYSAGIPMLIADRDFSKESCCTPFVLAEPHKPQSLIAAIVAAMDGMFMQPIGTNRVLAVSPNDRAVSLLSLFNQ